MQCVDRYSRYGRDRVIHIPVVRRKADQPDWPPLRVNSARGLDGVMGVGRDGGGGSGEGGFSLVTSCSRALSATVSFRRASLDALEYARKAVFELAKAARSIEAAG